MITFTTKVKLIFIPYLLMAVATIVGYTFIHWLFFVRNDELKVDEMLLDLALPMALPGIPILIWLRPRLKMLNLKNKKGSYLALYIYLLWIIMIIPLAVSQAYMETATGKLTQLDNVNQISQSPKTKYYTLKHFYVDKRLVRAKSSFEVSGKYSQNFDMTLYTASPVFDVNHNPDVAPPPIAPPVVIPGSGRSPLINGNGKHPIILVNGQRAEQMDVSKINPNDIKSVDILEGKAAITLYGHAAADGAIQITLKDNAMAGTDNNSGYTPYAWIAVKYEKTIDNKHTPVEKENLYKQFATESQRDFDQKDLTAFTYLDRINPSSDLKGYTGAVNAKSTTATIQSPIILKPVYEPFEARNGNKLAWLLGSFTIGSLCF